MESGGATKQAFRCQQAEVRFAELGPELIASCCNALRDSIQYALDHREEALQYAMQFARDLDPQMADELNRHPYVNRRASIVMRTDAEAIVEITGTRLRGRHHPQQTERGVRRNSTWVPSRSPPEKRWKRPRLILLCLVTGVRKETA